uniref:Uncharacterized protein n=1 Tax=Bostrychia tenella TaxID=324755 RepID=A0A1Z1M5L7_9FLOR|nr:hypothetical protein [Bostrychia tenella]ARW61153.1 hypothetical protein [Bostrychia tenella]
MSGLKSSSNSVVLFRYFSSFYYFDFIYLYSICINIVS